MNKAEGLPVVLKKKVSQDRLEQNCTKNYTKECKRKTLSVCLSKLLDVSLQP